MSVHNEDSLALGVDLAYVETGLALVSANSVDELVDLKIRKRSLIKDFNAFMNLYRAHRGVIEQAQVIFIEVPTTGYLGALYRRKKTRIETIERLTLALLSIEIALQEFEYPGEVYYLDPGKLARACHGFLVTREIDMQLRPLKLEGPKLVRRAWLHYTAPNYYDWMNPEISDHQSDAAFTGIVGLQVWKQGKIDTLISRKR